MVHDEVQPFLQLITSELEYGLHGVEVATRELALDDWEEKWASQGRCSKLQQKMHMCK